MAQWVGQPLKRVEDPRLLTGRGIFVADLPLKEPYAAAILRSPRMRASARSTRRRRWARREWRA